VADTALVEHEVAAGRELLLALDSAGFPVFAALWLLRPEATDWTLYLGSPEVDQYGRHEAYSRLQRVLQTTSGSVPLRAITLVGSQDPLLGLLSGAIAVEGTSEVRFQNNMINGELIPDALIYRLQRPPARTTDERQPSKRKVPPTRRTNAPPSGRSRK